jgi:hypothetical protein
MNQQGAALENKDVKCDCQYIHRQCITNPDMDCIKLEVATCKFGDQMTDG